MNDKQIEQQIAAARERAKIVDATEPRASAAYYDRHRKLVVIKLNNGVNIEIPPQLLQGLQNANDDEIEKIELEGQGRYLHWEKLDADFTIPGMAQGIFGTKAWMSDLGKKGGAVKSQTKAEAARENGKKGGRPPKNYLTTACSTRKNKDKAIH